MQVLAIADLLVRQGFSVDLVTVADCDGRLIRDGLRLIPLPRDRSRTTLLYALSRSRADIYVATCASPEVAVIAAYARLAGKIFVYRASHEIDCNGEYERGHGWRGRLFGLALRSAHAVVAQHLDQQRSLQSQGVQSTVIHNAFELQPEANRVRDIDALWVGRSEPWKNPGLFLRLAEKFPGRKFVSVCAPHPEYPELIEKLRCQAARLANVDFIEGVPYAESQRLFERARLLVGTSNAEGFPNTYIQACIAGTPIVSLKVDPESFIERADAGLVAHGSFHDLIRAVQELLEDDAHWVRCSKNARIHARRAHDMDCEGAKWVDLFQSLVMTRAVRSPRAAADKPDLI